MSSTLTVQLDCGHAPTATPTGNDALPGWGTFHDRTLCYQCCDREAWTLMIEAYAASEPFTAYVSGDGLQITTWTGCKLMTVIASHSVRLPRFSFFHGKTIQAITARDENGHQWFGRSSPGIAITLRRKRSKPSKVSKVSKPSKVSKVSKPSKVSKVSKPSKVSNGRPS